MKSILSNVVKPAIPPCILGGRWGTAVASQEAVEAALGKPSYVIGQPRHYPDGTKVTIGWVVNTPRGPATIRDYWWDAPIEWSLAAANQKAALWLAAFLRRKGIRASTRLVVGKDFEASLARLTP